jgi:HEAT repeat protein
VISVDEVQTAMRLVSWECVRDAFRPRSVTRDRLFSALARGMFGAEGDVIKPGPALEQARGVVTELETKLRLLQAVGPGGTEVKVALEPLAEYLAAAHVCAVRGSSAAEWRSFIDDVDARLTRQAPEELRGFLLAVRDSCAGSDAVPRWLESALAERGKYDVRAQAESRRERRLKFFTRRLQTGGDEERLEAVYALERGGHVDADAEAALILAVKTGGREVRARAIFALSQLDRRSPASRDALTQALRDQEQHVRFHAVLSCELAGEPQHMIAAILPLLRDPSSEIRRLVIERLAELGGPTVEPELRRLLHDPEHDVAVAAAVALTAVAPGPDSLAAVVDVVRSPVDLGDSGIGRVAQKFKDAPETLGLLADRLGDPSESVRTVWLRVLINACRETPAPHIVERVKPLVIERDPTVAIWAAVALWNWDLATPGVRSVIRTLAANPDPAVRGMALRVLAVTQPDADDRAVLKRSLSDPSDAVRLAAAAKLCALNDDIDDALEALGALVASPTAQTRYDVAAQMKDMQGVTLPGLEALLVRLVNDPHAQVRAEAAARILERKAPALLRALTGRSNDESVGLRERAAQAFALLNVTDEVELAPLRGLLQDPEFNVQMAAATAYWKLTRRGADILPVLYEFQAADFWWQRQSVFDLLTEMGKAGQGDIHLIKLGLQDGVTHARHHALQALLASGVIDPTVTDLVIEMLDDSYEYVRSEALEYVARAGLLQGRPRQRVVQLVGDPNRHVRIAALRTMGEFGPLSDGEARIVLEATRDDDERVRAMAAAALALVPEDRAEASWSRLIELLAGAEPLFGFRITRSLVSLARRVSGGPERLADATRRTADVEVRLALLRALGELGRLPQAALPPLCELLGAPNVRVRQRAADTLADHGSGTPEVVDALARAARDPGNGARAEALRALERLAPGHPETAELATECVSGADGQSRLLADAILAGRGVPGAGALVRAALHEPDNDPRRTALGVLRGLPGVLEVFHEDLKALLTHDDAGVRQTAAELLIEGPAADDAIATLGELLAAGKPAAAALTKAGPRAAVAVPALQRAVELGVESALPVLGALAPAEVTLQSVQQALLQTRPAVRAAAAALVPTLRDVPAAVRARLEDLTHDPAQEVRLAARAALASPPEERA